MRSSLGLATYYFDYSFEAGQNSGTSYKCAATNIVTLLYSDISITYYKYWIQTFYFVERKTDLEAYLLS